MSELGSQIKTRYGELREKTCENCGGKGKIDCSYCGGTGILDCAEDDVPVFCHKCNKGKQVCSACDGTGIDFF